MRTVLVLALCTALAGCAASPEKETVMTDDLDEVLAEALARAEAVARDRDEKLARMDAEARSMEAVADELVRLATPKAVALKGVPGSVEERRMRVYRVFLDTLREMRDDPQRDTQFRAVAETFAEMFEKRMTEGPPS